MSVGLLSLFEHIAAIMRTTAASSQGIAAQTVAASAQTVPLMIDDTAVMPSYIGGFSADRELPIVKKIAVGSLRNKLVVLLPLVMLISIFVPDLITPLLMLGGAYLCYEGAEKVIHDLVPGRSHDEAAAVESKPLSATEIEVEKVESAVKTDFVLSAEIMVIALSTLPQEPYLIQAVVLALVGVSVTAIIYGLVALIVKSDDVGSRWAREGRTAWRRGFGTWLVGAMPGILDVVAVVGTLAMLWLGGGFIAEGLAWFGLPAIEHFIVAAEEWTLVNAPFWGRLFSGFVGALLSAVVGLVAGLIIIPLVRSVVLPTWRAVRKFGSKSERA